MKILNLIEFSCQNTICRVKLHFFFPISFPNGMAVLDRESGVL